MEGLVPKIKLGSRSLNCWIWNQGVSNVQQDFALLVSSRFQFLIHKVFNIFFTGQSRTHGVQNGVSKDTTASIVVTILVVLVKWPVQPYSNKFS